MFHNITKIATNAFHVTDKELFYEIIDKTFTNHCPIDVIEDNSLFSFTADNDILGCYEYVGENMVSETCSYLAFLENISKIVPENEAVFIYTIGTEENSVWGKCDIITRNAIGSTSLQSAAEVEYAKLRLAGK